MASPSLLPGFNPTLLLVLNLVGTFVFGLSGGMAGVANSSTCSERSCSPWWWGSPAGPSATC